MKQIARESKTKPKLLVDGMLGSLSRKLRILGFDTIYNKDADDRELLTEAKSTGRYLVTSDIELFLQAKRMHSKAVLIAGTSEEKRLFELFSKLGIKPKIPFESRCSICNGELKRTLSVTNTGKVIYRCEHCGKDYWRGSHWKKLEALFRHVEYKLNNSRD